MSPGTMMHAEGDAILTEETVRDHEDHLHHTERHRMQCNKVMENSIGEERGRTFERSSLNVAEDRDIYVDPNDEGTNYNSAPLPNDPHNRHPLHYQECMKTKVHTVRKIAMLDELDLAPFLEKLGEFDIEGVAHAARGDDAHFVEVQMLDPKSTRIKLSKSKTSDRKNGWGLDTVKPDGIPNMERPHPLQKWIITSKTWDKEVRPRLDTLAKEFTLKNLGKITPESGVAAAPPDVSCDDFETLTDPKTINFKAEMTCLLKAIELQEKYVPFNHKLEKMQLVFRSCQVGGRSINCNTVGTLYVHDDKLCQDSADASMLDWIVPSTSHNPRDLRAYLPPGLKIEPDKMHMEGSINWAVTVSRKGYCTEASAPILYIGTGVDEDPDDPHDDVDLDLGAMFFRWKIGSGRARTQVEEVGSLFFMSSKAQGAPQQKPAQLYEESPGKFTTRACLVSGSSGAHSPSRERTSNCGSSNTATPALAEYSGDNLDGSGEGDDEWMAFDLERMRAAGITHVAIVVNIYNSGGERTTIDKVEGGFLRAVMSGRSEKEWATATTAQYVDLDTIPSAAGKTAAIVAVLYVDEIAHILAPKVSMDEAFDQPKIDKLTGDMTQLMHLWKSAGQISAEKRQQVEDKLRQLKANREFAQTRYELAVAKEGIPCSMQGCTLTGSRDGIKNFFMQDLSPTPVGDDNAKISDVQDKVASGNAVTNNDLEAQTVPNSGAEDLDAFLASLDEDIAPSPILDSPGTGAGRTEQFVSQQAAGMSEQEMLKELLIDFPGGPPGADTLCLKATAQKK
jgi:hypothetical protein